MLASLHPPPRSWNAENRFLRRFVGGQKQEEETMENRRGRTDATWGKKNRKTRVPTDVTPARSTRNDTRWSCLVYPNLPSASCLVHRSWRAFHGNFLLFYPAPHRMMHCALNCCRNANIVFVPRAKIYANLRAKNKSQMSRSPRDIITINCYEIHCADFSQNMYIHTYSVKRNAGFSEFYA